MSKKILIRRLTDIFQKIEGYAWYQKIQSLPFWIRMMLAILSIIFAILGFILPILPGWVGILLAIVLLVGMRRTQRLSFKFIYFTRIHILFSRIYLWWKNK